MTTERVLTHGGEIKLATTPQDIQDIVGLESLAFHGEGEDIYSLAMISKVGWILTVSSQEKEGLQGAIELVPTKQSGVGFIHGVVVTPEKQSNGTGITLIAQAEQVGLEAGMHQIDATIAPTNGASLNAFTNKSGYKATHFYPDFYGPGEHRFWVTKDLTSHDALFDEDNWETYYKSQEYANQHVLVENTDYENLAKLLNEEHYVMVGVVRPSKSGHRQNLLYLVQLPPEEVTAFRE